jgi:hypothetical protein
VRDITSVAAGPFAACAVSGQGATICWGQGEIFGEATLPFGPTAMPAPSEVADVGLGFTACAWTRPGGLFCWGRNVSGEVGDGTTLPLQVPYRVREPGKGSGAR